VANYGSIIVNQKVFQIVHVVFVLIPQLSLSHLYLQYTPPGFSLNLGLKDVNLFLDAGARYKCPSPIGSLLRDRFLSALAQHPGENLDWSAIALVTRSGAGLN
jgi:3-hydroxyisobutyrate dehydrogenase-like beta-hydroxyacid dehydrogenase